MLLDLALDSQQVPVLPLDALFLSRNPVIYLFPSQICSGALHAVKAPVAVCSINQ